MLCLSRSRTLAGCVSLAILTAALFSSAYAAGPQVLEKGKTPSDVRLQPLKDLNGYFPFKPPKLREEWDIRAAQLRRQLLVSLGLWPMPAKTPLGAVVHGKVDRGDYTVERVFFE
ncbi:MAG: hypothetical protein WD873_09100, partial [Candidatus Hydrogenedentales bacterium]